MSYQFTIQFSEEHIKYACRKYFARHVGIALPIVCLLMIFALIQRVFSGKTDMLAGCYLAIVIIGIGFFVSAYFQNRNYRLSQFRKSGNSVGYELTEEFFKAKSEMGSTELKWNSFKALWVFPKVWLLVFDKGGFLTMPVDQISNEVKDFLKQKIVSVGGKVK